MLKPAIILSVFALTALAPATAAVQVEPLVLTFTDGDGAGDRIRGTLTYDDAGVVADLDGSFTVNSDDNALSFDFVLPDGTPVDETDDFEFGSGFPTATFNAEGNLIAFEFLVLQEDLFFEVLGDLRFVFEVGPFDDPTSAGEGFLAAGPAAIPVPGAALLFVPAIAAFGLRRRFVSH